MHGGKEGLDLPFNYKYENQKNKTSFEMRYSVRIICVFHGVIFLQILSGLRGPVYPNWRGGYHLLLMAGKIVAASVSQVWKSPMDSLPGDLRKRHWPPTDHRELRRDNLKSAVSGQLKINKYRNRPKTLTLNLYSSDTVCKGTIVIKHRQIVLVCLIFYCLLLLYWQYEVSVWAQVYWLITRLLRKKPSSDRFAGEVTRDRPFSAEVLFPKKEELDIHTRTSLCLTSDFWDAKLLPFRILHGHELHFPFVLGLFHGLRFSLYVSLPFALYLPAFVTSTKVF